MECLSTEIPAEVVDKPVEAKDIPENAKETEEPAHENGKEEPEKAGEEYAYLERSEFTSEIFKIEVKNLGYFGIGVRSSILLLADLK